MDATPYALYLRKSVGRAGISRQRTVTTAHIEALGGHVAAEFADADRTAYRKIGAARPERENWTAMLAWLRAHPGAHVAAWHADRLTRSSEDTEDLITVCAAGGHLVETPRGGTYDLSTATGRKRLRSDAIDAAYEVDHSIERTTAAKLEAVTAGEDLGGRRRFGWRVIRTHVPGEEKPAREFVLEPGEAALIASGTQAIIEGVSLAEVTRRWRASGLTGTGGAPWRTREVSRCLRRARNAGLLEHRGKVAGPGNWPAIVTQEQWRAVCAILADEARRSTPGPAPKYLLSFIARCGVCGAGLIGTTVSRDGRPVYRCPARDGRVHVARDARALDEYVTGWALVWLEDNGPSLPAAVPETGRLKARVAAIEGELAELAELKEGLTVRQVAAMSVTLRERLEAAQAELDAAARPGILGVFAGRDPAQIWEGLSLEQKRAVVREVVTVKVSAAPKGRPAGWRPGRPYFHAESVDVAPRERPAAPAG